MSMWRSFGKIIPALVATLLCVGLYAGTLFKGPERDTEARIVHPLGKPLGNLPTCLTEAGEGQALCVWESGLQGNGKGKRIISGDCAADYVGQDQVALCVKAHHYDSVGVQLCNDDWREMPVELKKCYAEIVG